MGGKVHGPRPMPLAGEGRRDRGGDAQARPRALANLQRPPHLFLRGAPEAGSHGHRRRQVAPEHHVVLLFRQRGALRQHRQAPAAGRREARRARAPPPRRASRAVRADQGQTLGPHDQVRAGCQAATAVSRLLHRDAARGGQVVPSRLLPRRVLQGDGQDQRARDQVPHEDVRRRRSPGHRRRVQHAPHGGHRQQRLRLPRRRGSRRGSRRQLCQGLVGADGRGRVRHPRARGGGGGAGGCRGARARRRGGAQHPDHPRRGEGARTGYGWRCGSNFDGRAPPAGGDFGVPMARAQRAFRGRHVPPGVPGRGRHPPRRHRPHRLGQGGVSHVHGLLRASRPARQRLGSREPPRRPRQTFAQLPLLLRLEAADDGPHRGCQGAPRRGPARGGVPHGTARGVGRSGRGGARRARGFRARVRSERVRRCRDGAVHAPVHVRARQVLRGGPQEGELGELERVGAQRVPRG
mmetsp:Transcript_9614/g.37520  ORF Transcript_9614/g.37520 Transcript_9614/m.37520 type:complete len:465 (+) Transcript_9614:802-2196(+)